MTVTVVVAVFTVLLTLLVWSRSRSRRRPPGPRGLPVLGYLPWLDPARPYKSLTALARKFGPVFSVKMGSVDCVVVADNKIIRDLFSQDSVSGRPPLYLFSEVMEESGIIFSQSDTWREHRRFAGLAMRKQGNLRPSQSSPVHSQWSGSCPLVGLFLHISEHRRPPLVRSDGAGAGQVAVPHHGGDDGAVRREGRDRA